MLVLRLVIVVFDIDELDRVIGDLRRGDAARRFADEMHDRQQAVAPVPGTVAEDSGRPVFEMHSHVFDSHLFIPSGGVASAHCRPTPTAIAYRSPKQATGALAGLRL